MKKVILISFMTMLINSGCANLPHAVNRVPSSEVLSDAPNEARRKIFAGVWADELRKRKINKSGVLRKGAFSIDEGVKHDWSNKDCGIRYEESDGRSLLKFYVDNFRQTLTFTRTDFERYFVQAKQVQKPIENQFVFYNPTSVVETKISSQHENLVYERNMTIIYDENVKTNEQIEKYYKENLQKHHTDKNFRGMDLVMDSMSFHFRSGEIVGFTYKNERILPGSEEPYKGPHYQSSLALAVEGLMTCNFQ